MYLINLEHQTYKYGEPLAVVWLWGVGKCSLLWVQTIKRCIIHRELKTIIKPIKCLLVFFLLPLCTDMQTITVMKQPSVLGWTTLTICASWYIYPHLNFSLVFPNCLKS